MEIKRSMAIFVLLVKGEEGGREESKERGKERVSGKVGIKGGGGLMSKIRK